MLTVLKLMIVEEAIGMDFIIITGPQAVGKMAVGMALAERTGLKLFHNHMTIEPVIRLFDYGSKEGQYLIGKFREEIFYTMAKSAGRGMIFTYVWAFDLPSEYESINEVIKIFEDEGARSYIVELEADLEIRLSRNNTPLRLAEKVSKRNVEWSAAELQSCTQKYRLNSEEGEISHPNYLRINNNELSPEEVADQIIEHFELDLIEA